HGLEADGRRRPRRVDQGRRSNQDMRGKRIGTVRMAGLLFTPAGVQLLIQEFLPMQVAIQLPQQAAGNKTKPTKQKQTRGKVLTKPLVMMRTRWAAIG